MKEETLDRSHLIPCVNITSTGIKGKSIVRRFVLLKQKQKLSDRPAISDTNGYAIFTLELDTLFVSILEYLYKTWLSFSQQIWEVKNTSENVNIVLEHGRKHLTLGH